jgi:hypothetical protein
MVVQTGVTVCGPGIWQQAGALKSVQPASCRQSLEQTVEQVCVQIDVLALVMYQHCSPGAHPPPSAAEPQAAPGPGSGEHAPKSDIGSHTRLALPGPGYSQQEGVLKSVQPLVCRQSSEQYEVHAWVQIDSPALTMNEQVSPGAHVEPGALHLSPGPRSAASATSAPLSTTWASPPSPPSAASTPASPASGDGQSRTGEPMTLPSARITPRDVGAPVPKWFPPPAKQATSPSHQTT